MGRFEPYCVVKDGEKMKYVYILEVVEETEDEVSMKIDSVYTTREKAEAIGKNLVASENNGITYYSVTRYLIFQ